MSNDLPAGETRISTFAISYSILSFTKFIVKQGVALTGRNMTGPRCSVGRPTVYVPGGRPAGQPAGSVTDDDRRRRQTTVSKTILAY